MDLRPLLDGQATLAGVRAAFLEQAAKTGPDDVFVLYLAGRGLALDGRYHFLALEGIEGPGVFTHVLLAGLHGGADATGNQNQEIEVSELADYLDREVPRVSQERFGYAIFPMRDLQGQSFTIGRVGGAPPP